VSQSGSAFREPNALERFFNKAFGVIVGWGLGPRDYYLVQVRGRRTGRVYATPVNVVELQGIRFLVAPRGRTQWVRNAEAAGEVHLKRGSTRQRFRIRAVADREKLPVLRTYLDRFRRVVQRYFPVPAGAPLEAFAAIVERYPVFELLPSNHAEGTRGEGAR
jgi:deazaflavin-dependent oxidoreductase (nitroreductase family)